MIVVGTITADHRFPSASNLICHKSGATNAWGFDVSAACSGFLYTLVTGQQFIISGQCKKVIVIGGRLLWFYILHRFIPDTPDYLTNRH